MSILLSGDFHANAEGELGAITKKSLIKKYGREKYYGIQCHIILGDAGFMWPNNHKTDLFHYKTLACRPFPVLCVVGNHEPILGMNDVPEADIGIGETVYQIHDVPFIGYLKRGRVYTIDGVKFLVLGGALSVDKDDRKPNKTWWQKEYWTAQEKQDVLKMLENDNTFDCVISHTGPHHINKILFESLTHFSEKLNDEVSFLNDEIYKKIEFREWWCGHWHKNRYYFDTETKHGYQYLYKATKTLEKTDYGLITVYNENASEQR